MFRHLLCPSIVLTAAAGSAQDTVLVRAGTLVDGAPALIACPSDAGATHNVSVALATSAD